MNFEEMKKIWDTQNKKPMYAIDETTLLDIVKRKVGSTNRQVDLMEKGLLIINAIVFTVMMIKGINKDLGWINFLTAGIVFLVSTYVIVQRIRRKKGENRFDRSLLGDLDNAISNIKYHIRMGRTFLWWYLLPFALPTFFNMYNSFDAKTVWVWLGIAVMFYVAYRLTKWEVDRCHIPKKRSLEALRNTLTEEK